MHTIDDRTVGVWFAQLADTVLFGLLQENRQEGLPYVFECQFRTSSGDAAPGARKNQQRGEVPAEGREQAIDHVRGMLKSMRERIGEGEFSEILRADHDSFEDFRAAITGHPLMEEVTVR